MNCLWIILLLSCFGGCGCNQGNGRDNNCGCNNNGRNNNGCCNMDGQRNRCRRAVERAVDECGSERAVMRTLKERDHDRHSENSGCQDQREERAERRGERTADNNNCDAPGMNPSHWQDFPEVSRSSSHDDCGCNS